MSTTQSKPERHEIVIDGQQPLVIDLGSPKRGPNLEEREARMLTHEIQRTTVRLWLLVTEAHDRAAHAALGYETWDDYVRAELKMSPSRSYQLLETGHVMKELAIAGVDVEQVPPPPTRIVARIKDRLPDVRKVAREAVRKGESPDKALRTLARQPRAAVPAGPVGPAAEEAPTAGLIQCPACGGEGKVPRSLAMSLRAWLRKREAGEAG